MTPTTSKRQQSSHGEAAVLRWTLLLSFLLSLGIVLMLAEAEPATAYGLQTESPPPSPLPGPIPILEEVVPSSGVTNRPIQLTIHGQNFHVGGKGYLVPSHAGPGQVGWIQLHRFAAISPSRLSGVVPAGIAPGKYDLVVTWPDRSQGERITLVNAYRALDPASGEIDDLRSYSYALWADQNPVYMDQEVRFGLKVEHFGSGQGVWTDVAVDFYVDKIVPERKIGRGIVPFLGPDSTASTTAVPWTFHNFGEVTLYAVLDPDDAIQESNEENNVIRRTLQVRRQPAPDRTPPIVDSFEVEAENGTVSDREITLLTAAHDPEPNPSGVDKVHFVEYQWFSGAAANTGIWVPVNSSGWLPFANDAHSPAIQSHRFTLHPNSGVRYLTAWVADRAGNVSLYPEIDRVNYILSPDSLVQGEIRVHRVLLEADRCLRVTVTPSRGDPDLYVWAPDATLAGSSRLTEPFTDQVTVQPTQEGIYQIEVEGWSDTTFTITVETPADCDKRTAPKSNGAKAKPAPRTTPAIPLDDLPDEEVVAPETFKQYLAFLTALLQPEQKATPADAVRTYLPFLRN